MSRKLQTRRGSGHTVIELAVFAFLLMIFTYVCADVGVLLFGSAMNDRACRDAARAAAHGSNATEASQLAAACLKTHSNSAFFVSQPTVVGSVTYQDYSGSPPPQTTPYVEVTTQATAKLPFAPIVFFNDVTFGQSGSFTFKRTYVFPIVRFKFAST